MSVVLRVICSVISARYSIKFASRRARESTLSAVFTRWRLETFDFIPVVLKVMYLFIRFNYLFFLWKASLLNIRQFNKNSRRNFLTAFWVLKKKYRKFLFSPGLNVLNATYKQLF